MRRTIVIALCGATVVFAVVGAATWRGEGADREFTPRGAATLWSAPPSVGAPEKRLGALVSVRIRVRPGGDTGPVRVRALADSFDRNTKAVIGPPFMLPSTPGVYTLPAPHIRWDTRLSSVAIDQLSGHDAITQPCSAVGHDKQRCEEASLQVFRPPLTTASSPRGQRPTSRYPGRELAIEPIYDPAIEHSP